MLAERQQAAPNSSYKPKPYIVKHNSMILLRCFSYIVSFNGMFRL